jgi:hypothetical protein
MQSQAQSAGSGGRLGKVGQVDRVVGVDCAYPGVYAIHSCEGNGGPGFTWPYMCVRSTVSSYVWCPGQPRRLRLSLSALCSPDQVECCQSDVWPRAGQASISRNRCLAWLLRLQPFKRMAPNSQSRLPTWIHTLLQIYASRGRRRYQAASVSIPHPPQLPPLSPCASEPLESRLAPAPPGPIAPRR